MIDGAVLGGLMLILGNYLVFKGKVYQSIKVFLLADFAWLWLAIASGNIFGIVTVAVGVVLSFFAFWKMHTGVYNKTIIKEHKGHK